jgi:nucleoside-diphosphate-sugar epimerase
MMFTVFGGAGFIGSAMVAALRAAGAKVYVPGRNEPLSRDHLGHVIYAIGVTADFRQRPFDTMEAHVGVAARILHDADFDSFLYLSSTRLYRHAESTEERERILVDPADPEDFYDLTKLAGEALCHHAGRRNVRIARLSNVIGHDFRSRNFVFDLMRAAWTERFITLRSAVDSSKDYIMVEDVVHMLPLIATRGRHPCYNLASGINLRHADILAPIVQATGASVTIAEGVRTETFPLVDTGRLRSEFDFVPTPVLPRLAPLTREFGKSLNA